MSVRSAKKGEWAPVVDGMVSDQAETIQQLERSLLKEIAAHDKTMRRLEARERELERIRSNNYADRVKSFMGEG